MYREIFLALSVSIDTYLASVLCSGKNIKVPLASALVISVIGGAVMWISLFISSLIGGVVPTHILRTGGLILLTAVGSVTIARSIVRSVISRLSDGKPRSLRMDGANLMIRLYLDDSSADIDDSKVLNPAEAVMIALISSFDAATVGLSCGFTDISAPATSLLTLLAGFLAVILGTLTSKKISSLRHDFSWVGGIFIIIFAIVCYIS